MTWEEAIEYIRNDINFKELVDKAYLESDLKLNVDRFKNRNEFKETIKIFNEYAPNAKSILDIGCGNGVSSISFALDGYKVTAVEPDSSETIGANAIRKLTDEFQLTDSVKVIESTSEDLIEKPESYDIVYIRQAMHHANNLNQFVSNATKFLKKGGLFITVRDHVIYNENDKALFLKNHPLHKYYGGENAFTSRQYKHAIKKAGIKILKELQHYDSVINYYPTENPFGGYNLIKSNLMKKYGKMLVNDFTFKNFARLKKLYPDEKIIPGRMYSYIGLKR